MLKQLGIPPDSAQARFATCPRATWSRRRMPSRGARCVLPFSPVADGDVIPADPVAAIAAGSARGMPLIVGTNLEEMKLYRFLDPTIDALDATGLVDRVHALMSRRG